jgi:hypothetical protein
MTLAKYRRKSVYNTRKSTSSSPYVVCEVIDIAGDSKFYNSGMERIVIERRMLHEVTIGLETHYLVLENYVFGRIQ